MRHLALGIAFAALVAGCSGAAPSATPRTISGTLTLTADSSSIVVENLKTLTGCHGAGGYVDMQPGTGVVVKDQAGTIVGTGSLQAGQFDNTKFPKGVCRFPFSVTVPDVPFYSIEVSHRGALTYSKADLDAKNWHVDLTLGS